MNERGRKGKDEGQVGLDLVDGRSLLSLMNSMAARERTRASPIRNLVVRPRRFDLFLNKQNKYHFGFYRDFLIVASAYKSMKLHG